MHKDRIELLADDLRNHVFQVLDAEPETDAKLCGIIAAAVESLFSVMCAADEPGEVTILHT